MNLKDCKHALRPMQGLLVPFSICIVRINYIAHCLCCIVIPALTCLVAAGILRGPMPTTSPLPLTDVLRALADAGASDSLLGQVVRELVVSKTSVLPHSGTPMPPPP